MKCPRCGLVHAPMDQVCRRCEIDLKTGEPAARQGSSQALPEPGSALLRWRDRARTIGLEALKDKSASLRRSFKDKDKAEMPERKGPPLSMPDEVQPVGWIITISRREKSRIVDMFKERRQRGVREISCAQCGESMSVIRATPYPLAGPVMLAVMGIALLVTAFFFPLLLITGTLSILSGAIYLRLGRTFWKCSTCGFTVARAGRGG